MSSKRTPFIAGNWKMHTSGVEAVALCRTIRERIDEIEGVDKAVCPPSLYLRETMGALSGSTIRVGAQNVHWEDQGAYTGEISPLMLQDLAEFVIVGHSERRQYFCETDATVNQRLNAALRHDLTPIFCIGESKEERESGQTNAVLTRQVTQGLNGLPWNGGCVIAYEPVWAIGTGLAASGEQANETIGFIRELVAEVFGKEIAEANRIQYGGSVKPENAAEFFTQPEIDGALVGGASLDADAFAGIVRAAAEAAG